MVVFYIVLLVLQPILVALYVGLSTARAAKHGDANVQRIMQYFDEY